MIFLRKKIIIFFVFLLNFSYVNSSENLVFIDIDLILNNSNYGLSIYKELEKINTENIKKINNKEKIIKEKKEKIEKIKNISSKEKLEDEIIKFNKEVENFRNEKNKLVNDFKILKKKKLDNFLMQINPIIQEYMKKNSIDIIFDKKQIFIGNSDKDATNDLIKIIDDKLKNNG